MTPRWLNLDRAAEHAGFPRWVLDDGTILEGRRDWARFVVSATPWEINAVAFRLGRSEPFLELGAGKTNMALLRANPPPPRPTDPDARLASIAHDLEEIVVGDPAFIPELAAAGGRLPPEVFEHTRRVSVIVTIGITEHGFTLAHTLPTEKFVVVIGPSHVERIFAHECSHVFSDLIAPAIDSGSGFFQSCAKDERGRVSRAATAVGRGLEADYAAKEARARVAAWAWLLDNPDNPDAGPDPATS